ncbi:MAG: DUF373 family protein [Candidatus Diapherotrites archaeon]|nr:DUF373 family protein [Candidatus Diapherotrites archaeon]
MAKEERILVLCVDRDDDIGIKTGVAGPIIGRKENIEVASKLGVADPSESDTNSIFAAVKKAEEIEAKGRKVQVATVTGIPALGFKADKKIIAQLDEILKEFPADGIVFVSDGAEDEQIIPLISSKVPIISKETVIVKQSKELEKTYYVIKDALKDPTISKLVIGLPGLVLLLYFLIGESSIRYMLIVLGAYLIFKGFGIEDWFISGTKNFFSGLSLQRLSFPFYLAVLVFLAFTAISAYGNYMNEATSGFVTQWGKTLSNSLSYFALAGIFFVVGKIVDAHYLGKAHKLRTYLITLTSIIVVWYLLITSINIALGVEALSSVIYSLILGAIVLVISMQGTKIFIARPDLNKDLEGQEVFSENGKRLGEVAKVDKKKNLIYVKPDQGRQIAVAVNRISPRKDGLVKLA